MKNTTKPANNQSNEYRTPIRLFVLALIVLTITSGIFLRQSWSTSTGATEKHALSTANAAANSLSREKIKLLHAIPEDENSDTYKQLKNNLIGLAENNTEIRFVYLYVQRDGKIYFMADSEPADSKDYSPPGQEYTEADTQYTLPFKDGNTLITSKVTDRWGDWISVLIPIKDGETGAILAVLGLDYPVTAWYSPAVINILQTSTILLAAYILSTVFYFLMIKNARLRDDQKQLQMANEETIRNEQKALLSRNEIKQQSDMQKLLLDISAGFTNVDFDSISPVINTSLEKVGKALTADRVYIFKYNYTAQTCKNTFEWCAPGIESQIDNMQVVPFSSMNDWPDIHKKGESIIIPDVSALPKGEHLRNILEPQGTKSLLAVPMMLGDFCFGFAGLEYFKEHHTFNENEQCLLEQCGNMLISTFSRIKLDKELRESEEKYRSIFEFTPIGVFNFDRQGFIVDCNDFFVSVIGSSREALIGLELLKLPDIKIVECVKSALQGNITEYRGDYHSVTADKVTSIRAKFSPIFLQEHKIIGGTGIVEDVTERKKIQDELRLKSMVLEQLEEHITITDPNGVISYVNQAQVDKLKFSREKIIGLSTKIFGEDSNRGAEQNEIVSNTLERGF